MYVRLGKRILDAAAAELGLVLLLPVMLGVSIFLLIRQGRPFFYSQSRVGRGGRCFSVVKFRTMTAGCADRSTITVSGDARITPAGRILRRWKLDEIPQLWNVLKGEMSLVGPRPAVSGYYDRLQGTDRRVLFLRPGITGPASLKYADEERILARQSDPVRYNDETIFPDKVRLNLRYRDECSLRLDLRYLRITLFGR
jgi:lipopolysaccharide/colanic/teichoic acid biosynthesis glycosyltransferase